MTAGRIPRDRLALRELHREVTAWPYLGSEEELQEEQQAESNYEGITDTGRWLYPLLAGLFSCC